jgi:hypothetical protein
MLNRKKIVPLYIRLYEYAIMHISNKNIDIKKVTYIHCATNN